MTQRELRHADYIAHMLEASALVQSYVAGMSKADFRLAHGYFDINLDVVRETVRHALPELENKLRPIEQAL